jgi:hypothetical protein
MSTPSNSAFHHGPNVRPRLLAETALEVCPTCQRPFTADDKASRSRAEAHERARADSEQRQRRELQAATRDEGIKIGQNASQEHIETLMIEKATLEANVETRVSEGVEAKRHEWEAGYAAERTLRFQENEKLKKQVAALTRDLDERKANALGEGAEVNLFRQQDAAWQWQPAPPAKSKKRRHKKQKQMLLPLGHDEPLIAARRPHGGAERRPATPTGEQPMPRLLIMACSATKRHDAGDMPAIDRYIGPLWQTLRSVDPTGKLAKVAFLSAKFGFRRASTPIETTTAA